VDRIYAGSLDGVLLRRVLTREECAAAMAEVGRFDTWQEVYHDPDAPKTIGTMLSPSPIHPDGPPPDVYFQHAEADARWVQTALHPLLPRLEAQLSSLAGERDVRVLNQPREHRCATVRLMDVGYGAPDHVDAYRNSPGLASLFDYTDRRTQLSWYVLLQASGTGGCLEVQARGAPDRLLPVTLEVGDGVLFDGSQLRHRVAPVTSSPGRCTVGGFAGLARDDRTLYYWG